MLALAGAWLLAANGLLSGSTQQTASNDYVTKETLDGVNAEIATLREQVGASGATPEGQPVDLAPLEQRLTELETSTADVAAIKQTADAAGESAKSANDAASALMDASDRSSKDSADAVKQAAAANQAAGAAQEAATNAQNTANGAQANAQSAIETAKEAAAAASSAKETADATTAKLDSSLADLGTRVAAIEEANTRAQIALAAANLKSAIDAGGPFADQLETYATTSGSGDTIESLRTFAADGVPTEQQLAAQWPEVEAKISATMSALQPNAPVSDQMLAGLRSLVQVRPSGSAPPSDTSDDAVLSRLNAAIRTGDLQSFSTQWETLPEDAKSESREFADKVQARLTAQKVVSSTLSGAISDVGPASTDKPAAEPANQG